jgi:ankyrin repeat protein
VNLVRIPATHWESTLGEKVNNYGPTALHYASLAGKIVVVKLLLGNISLAYYILGNDGLFPVHTAALTGKVNVVRECIKICPNVDELPDIKHRHSALCGC